MRFASFPLHLCQAMRLPRKSGARSSKVLHLSRKILISLMHMSLVLRLPREMHLSRSSSNVPRPPSFSDMPQNPHALLTWQGAESLTTATQNHIFKSGPRLVCFAHFDFDMCFVPQQRALFQHLNIQKCSDPGVFCTF